MVFIGRNPDFAADGANDARSIPATRKKGKLMHWNIALTMMAALGAGVAPETTEFNSYTKAYWTANAEHRPLLVILTAPGEAAEELPLAQVKQDADGREILSDYVVAVIDTGTEHGQIVHELFGSPTLPRTVVIDERQEKQIFRTSDRLQPATLTSVLEQYRDGVPKTVTVGRPIGNGSLNSFQQGVGNCPNCRKF
jgi:hypothetical protein